MIGMELSDFIIMNPDYLMDHTAYWDHRLYEGNSPYLHDMIIHHAASTDPRIKEAINIQLLDLNNPYNEPNDGIMYTFDEFFHSQKPEASFHTPGGDVVAATHHFFYTDHMTYPDTDNHLLVVAANLFHHRKAYVTLSRFFLYNDREGILDGENGTAPAEVSVEVEVHFPYVADTFGQPTLVNDMKIAHRSSPLWLQEENTYQDPAIRLYEGPVFDGMTSLRLNAKVLEVDYYPRFGVYEWAFDADESLVDINQDVPLENHQFEVDSQYGRAVIDVKVVTLY